MPSLWQTLSLEMERALPHQHGKLDTQTQTAVVIIVGDCFRSQYIIKIYYSGKMHYKECFFIQRDQTLTERLEGWTKRPSRECQWFVHLQIQELYQLVQVQEVWYCFDKIHLGPRCHWY